MPVSAAIVKKSFALLYCWTVGWWEHSEQNHIIKNVVVKLSRKVIIIILFQQGQNYYWGLRRGHAIHLVSSNCILEERFQSKGRSIWVSNPQLARSKPYWPQHHYVFWMAFPCHMLWTIADDKLIRKVENVLVGVCSEVLEVIEA